MRKLLFVLLATNAITLLLLVLAWREKPEPLPSQPDFRSDGDHAPVRAADRNDVPQLVNPGSPARVFSWETVESTDYREYIANLRQIGCPEETIHDIIKSDVKKLFASRKATMPKTEFEYWRTGNFLGELLDEASIQEHQAQVEEQRALLRELLGTEVELDDDVMTQLYNPLEASLQFLAPSNQMQLMTKRQAWQAEAMKYVGSGAPDSEDLKNLQQVRDAMEEELTTMLSPEDKRKYDLRLSSTAQQMRLTMGDFDPTEQEFQDIFDLRKAFDDEHSVMGIPPVDEQGRQARRVAAEQLEADLKALLGPDRYAEYDRASKREYQTALKIAERQGLDRTAAVDIYNMKITAQEAAKILHAKTSLPEAQRAQILHTIRLETEQSIRNILGPEGLESYRSQQGGQWIKNLSPDP